MDSPEASSAIEQIRISKIADRYLVFDADHVSILRRRHHLCSVLVGSTPQNPTQNVFLSLPLELLPEEAALLLDQKAAVLADEATSHLAALKEDRCCRKQYIDQLNDRRQQAKQHLAEGQAQKAAQSRELAAKAKSQGSTAPEHAQSSAHGNVDPDRLGTARNTHLTDEPKPVADRSLVKPLTITNTTSLGLILQSVSSPENDEAKPAVGPLHAHLLSQGYFMTPGLRFGAKYSVYPGDPLRYHAHFLATDYEWEEEISMLDMVGSGRLGTSVKKGFLLGGEVPRNDTTGGGDPSVRAFCIEWAGM